jgi:hypothetical protein
VRTQDTHLFAVPSVSSRSISAPVAPPRPVPSIALQMLTWLDVEPASEESTEQAPVTELAQRSTISFLPRLLALAPIQRHVLKCVATHCWTHQGSIPYHPPTEYQARIACDLAGPSRRLLLQKPMRQPTYTLTRLGDAVARRVLHVVPAASDRAREREFDRMRALMRHDLRSLTTLDVDDDDDA